MTDKCHQGNWETCKYRLHHTVQYGDYDRVDLFLKKKTATMRWPKTRINCAR